MSAPVFRLLTDEEVAAYDAAPPLPIPRIRPHCATCGKWVPSASVKRRTSYYGPSEDDWSGTCKTHGERVDVVWDEG